MTDEEHDWTRTWHKRNRAGTLPPYQVRWGIARGWATHYKNIAFAFRVSKDLVGYIAVDDNPFVGRRLIRVAPGLDIPDEAAPLYVTISEDAARSRLFREWVAIRAPQLLEEWDALSVLGALYRQNPTTKRNR